MLNIVRAFQRLALIVSATLCASLIVSKTMSLLRVDVCHLTRGVFWDGNQNIDRVSSEREFIKAPAWKGWNKRKTAVLIKRTLRLIKKNLSWDKWFILICQAHRIHPQPQCRASGRQPISASVSFPRPPRKNQGPVRLFGGWCWFIPREKYCWLVADGWFVLREKYCCLVADKPNEQAASRPVQSPYSRPMVPITFQPDDLFTTSLARWLAFASPSCYATPDGAITKSAPRRRQRSIDGAWPRGAALRRSGTLLAAKSAN
jgi:hypothetical protein